MWEWVTKFQRGEPSITRGKLQISPSNTFSFVNAYREIEVVRRSIELIVNALTEVPYLVEGGPAKKLSKLLNTRPNPFESRSRLFRRAYLDFNLEGNVFFYYDNTNLYVLEANAVTVVPDEKTFVSHYVYRPIEEANTFFGNIRNNARILSSPSIFSNPNPTRASLTVAIPPLTNVLQ